MPNIDRDDENATRYEMPQQAIEAADVPEPVGYVVHTFIGEQKARWYTPLNGGTKLYGDNLLAAYRKALAELTQMYRSFEGHVYVKNEEYSSLVQRAETTERQLAELREKHERLVTNNCYFYSLTELLAQVGFERESTVAGAIRWGAISGRIADEENQ